METIQVISSDAVTMVVEVDTQAVAVVSSPAGSPSVIVEALRGEPGPPGSALSVKATTEDGSSVLVGGLVSLPSTISACRITGQVVAQDTASGDCAIWDIATAAKRPAADAALAWVGVPCASPFAADSALAACTLGWSLASDGPQLVLTGLVGHTLAWTAAFAATVTGAST